MAKKAKKAKASRKKSAARRAAGPNEDAVHRMLRTIHARFARAVPATAASTGAHQPDTPIEAKGVPNGVFRVAGSDWLMHVKNGAVALFERARADFDPKGVKEVPPEIA